MYAEAIDELKRAAELDPRFSEARMNLGAVYLETERWDEAIAEFEAVLGDMFYRTPHLAHNNLGWAWFNKGEYDKAVESYRTALELDPSYAVASNNLGLALERLDRLDEAEAAFRRAASNMPGFVDAYYNLGLILLKKKDKAGAAEAFQAVIDLAPRSERAGSARQYLELMK